MIIAVGIAVIAVLILMGTPLFISFLAGASIICLGAMGLPLEALPQLMFAAVNSYVLMAVPLFLFAGNLMTYGGPSRDLVEWVDAWVGHLPGGLATVTVVSCMFFAALSGSSPATAVAIGSTMIGPMEERGYDRKFSAGVACAAGTLGILIPPSIAMVIYSVLTETSVAELFMAGFLPGLLLGTLLIGTAAFVSKKKKYGVHPPLGWGKRGTTTMRALPVLGMPVLVLGGIYGGIFTPTEAAAIACLYSILLCFAYRSLNIGSLRKVLKDSVLTTAMAFVIVAAVVTFGRVFTFTQAPQALTRLITESGLSIVPFLLLINVFYLAIGCVFENVTIQYLTIPLLFPAIVALGIDPVHFGIIMVVNLEMALITPPVGVNLFVMSGASKLAIGDVAKGVVPFYAPMIIGLFLITYIPQISLFLPQLVFGD